MKTKKIQTNKDDSIKKPNFFIIGAPKCGTTSMTKYLTKHPNIFISGLKEPHYFSTDFSQNHKVKSEKNYLKLFHGAREYKAVGEGSTDYLLSKKAIPNILEFNPKAKFIVMIRNPVEMFRSLHFHLLSDSRENQKNPETAWKLQKVRKRGSHIPCSVSEPKILQYGKWCKLGEQTERLLNLVSKKQVKFIELKDFKKHPRKTYLQVLNFLDVKDDKRKNFPIHNPAHQFKVKFIKKALNLIPYTNKTREISRKIKKKLKIKHWPLLNTLGKWNEAKKKKPKISKELRKYLKNYFKEDIRNLEKLINKDLDRWLE